jgi:hypothetical protein
VNVIVIIPALVTSTGDSGKYPALCDIASLAERVSGNAQNTPLFT